ncbi:BlaI/MecI/CopY family transcriptional regulator [Frateuria aurantia]
MSKPSIGDQELALLGYLAEHEPATVAEVVAGYGEPLGLARSTVLTMMERLRAKGYLKRQRSSGAYAYATTTGPAEVMRGAVASFVEKTLRGSVSPFVNWMAERGQVSERELAELEALVSQLQSTRKTDASHE